MKQMLLLLLAMTFLAAVVAGIGRFGLPEASGTGQMLEGTWNYETDTGQSGKISLPGVLSLLAGTAEVRLDYILPDWTGEAYALHFVSMEQMAEVLVDGFFPALFD